MKENTRMYNLLLKFLKQAKTDDTTSKQYKTNYLGTEVKVSFGQGNTAKVPWIAFLKGSNKVTAGIYPVYLYYKNVETLVLAYGKSEKYAPELSWGLDDKMTIQEYFLNTYSKKPHRYGTSYVFKVYNVKQLPSADIIESDLKQIIQEYNQLLGNINSVMDLDDPIHTPAETLSLGMVLEPFTVAPFTEALEQSGLRYSKELITRFVASLLTKPFLILTGLSGSGKTKLAQAFAQWICKDKNQYKLVPVGADWTNREPLLGYPNALKPEEYVKPDSGVLDLVIHANEQKEVPHFLILDEMNLSIVERYFADFLSVMESGKDISLFPEGKTNNGVPHTIGIPNNLFIIGTVNIDETTHMFSPKVLDRANTIEFKVSSQEMQEFLNYASEIHMEALTGKGDFLAKSFMTIATKPIESPEELDEIKDTLIVFFDALKKIGAEFGYRSALEIVKLIQHLSTLDNNLSTQAKVDMAIVQKLLPKLHGSRRKLCPILEILGGFCITDNGNVVKEVFENTDFNFNAPQVLYPLSLEKITRMYRGAVENGFASFAEA
ncbi:MAG: DUF3578 domain-containing protein [Bacteroidales bacterium]|jgi:5-methylcytosine-specific restriction protein B|nr:DUF3578 domain-containing protein [Bacteroidales bacterium]MDY0175156.1 DUF3578 domain-containing protein [Bacteroidales bacterium]HHV41199.1 DUF3578 domain-containing protein [Bacteroidales bacterium]